MIDWSVPNYNDHLVIFKDWFFITYNVLFTNELKWSKENGILTWYFFVQLCKPLISPNIYSIASLMTCMESLVTHFNCSVIRAKHNINVNLCTYSLNFYVIDLLLQTNDKILQYVINQVPAELQNYWKNGCKRKTLTNNFTANAL